MSHACGCGNHSAAESPPRVTRAQTVAEVATRVGAREVLTRLGINHCCGAHLTLVEAAAAAGVPLDELLRALDEAATISA